MKFITRSGKYSVAYVKIGGIDKKVCFGNPSGNGYNLGEHYTSNDEFASALLNDVRYGESWFAADENEVENFLNKNTGVIDTDNTEGGTEGETKDDTSISSGESSQANGHTISDLGSESNKKNDISTEIEEITVHSIPEARNILRERGCTVGIPSIAKAHEEAEKLGLKFNFKKNEEG